MRNLSYENEFCMQLHFHAIQSHFHKNGFALRLALQQRHKGTQKWPITPHGRPERKDRTRLLIGHTIFFTSEKIARPMRLLLVKERLFLFGELALSKSQYLYKKRRVFVLFFTVYNSFACMSKAQQARNTTSFMYIKNTFIKPW